MAWQMPPGGPWGGGMPMGDMSMGTMSAEQWAIMQQQNWQQWIQWQHQYAQWQSQYGEKYAQQMQAMQSMCSIPPLPGTAPPLAPPLPPSPDKNTSQPPSPENNKPLYVAPIPPHNGFTGEQQVQVQPYMPVQPVPPVNSNQHTPSVHSGQSAPPSQPIPSGNTEPVSSSGSEEALKKLAEDERLFDIQFQKWEEEIDKWRRENVNHPDKKAYQEYEQKFEACRAQLLERRNQMNQKKARLMNSSTPVAGNVSGNLSQFKSNTSNNSHNQIQNLEKNQDNNNYQRQFNQNNMKTKSSNRYNSDNDHQDHIDDHSNSNKYQENNDNSSSRDYPSNDDYPTDDYPTHDEYPENDPYPQNDDEYQQDNSSFLPTSGGAKNIPGLDLVPDSEKSQNHEVIDITGDKGPLFMQNAPDYSKISKGINNILGDEKIMNILSMVRSQTTSAGNNLSQNINNISFNSEYALQNNKFDMNNRQYDDNRQNNTHFNNDRLLNTAFDNNKQNNGPYNKIIDSLSYPMHQNQNQFNRLQPSSNTRGINDERQSNVSQYYNENSQPGGKLFQQRNDPSRPHTQPLLELPVQAPNFSRPQLNVGKPPKSNRKTSPAQPKWGIEPLFTPSIIVEYEHKPLRLKARDFIEPVHMFDYNHKSKDGETKKRNFEKEVDEFFSRKPRRANEENFISENRYSREHSRDYERRLGREDFRDDFRRRPPREEFEKNRSNDYYDARRRDDRFSRRSDIYKDRERERDIGKGAPPLFPGSHRDREFSRKDDRKPRSRSRSSERSSRKRAHSRDNPATTARKAKEDDSIKSTENPKHIVMIDDILEPPGRNIRPEKIVIILRGLPGSGKSYLAKLIRDKEAEYGGTARIMSIDDYFMQEGEMEETDPATGKTVKKPTMKYEYDEKSEETYLNSLTRAFKRSITDGYFTFLIYDAVNEHIRSYADVWSYARKLGFQVYVCTMEQDVQACFKRNIHNRTLEDIQEIKTKFYPTPPHHIELDVTSLLQNAAITEVQMEDAVDEVVMEDVQDAEVESVFTSRWEKMDDAVQLARLDGISKPLRPSQLSMEDYLQLDEWTPNKAIPGKKSVRWADIEERREQEKMRAIGFVVGQTDWNRMTDPTMGSSALTQTKYIERVRRF